MRSGWSSGSIYSVPLVSGWFSVSKTIIPEAQENFLTPSARRDTHPFGGLGFSSASPQSLSRCGAGFTPSKKDDTDPSKQRE